MNRVEKDSKASYDLTISEDQLQLIRKLLIEAELNYKDSVERELLMVKMVLNNY